MKKNKSTKDQIKNRVYLGLLIVVCLGISSTGIYFHNQILGNINTPANNLQAQLFDVQNNWSDIEGEILEKYLPQKINTELRRSAFAQMLPAEFDRSELLSTLEKISIAHEININQVNFAQEEDRGDYRELTLAIQLNGPRQKLLNFLGDIGGQDRNSPLPLLSITDLALNHESNNNIVPLLAIGGDEDESYWLLEIQAETYARK